MTWVAYDAVTGDVLADGPELPVRRYAVQCGGAVTAAAEGDWRRGVQQIALRMSGNPPRRNRETAEHL